MEFLRISETEFSQFSQKHENANFWQSTSMAHLREWNGWNCFYVAVKEENEILAAAMISYRNVFLKGTFAQAVRGFYIDYHNQALLRFFHENLLEVLKEINCMYFKIDPYLCVRERDINGDLVEQGYNNMEVVHFFQQLGYQHNGFLVGNDVSREPNWMFVTDLAGKDEAQLLKAFYHQTRRSIQKTGKLNLIVKEAKQEDLVEVQKVMDHTADRRGFMNHDQHYYEGLFASFDKDHLKILFAQLDVNAYCADLQKEDEAIQKEQNALCKAKETLEETKYAKKQKVLDDKISVLERKLEEAATLKQASKDGILTLSVAVFMVFGNEVVYLYGGSYHEYMKFNGSYALQWYMIRYALAHSIERFNFYGISGDFSSDAEDYGVYEFKKGFTGTVEELVGDFYLYLQPNKYKLYQWLRSIKRKLAK